MSSMTKVQRQSLETSWFMIDHRVKLEKIFYKGLRSWVKDEERQAQIESELGYRPKQLVE